MTSSIPAAPEMCRKCSKSHNPVDSCICRECDSEAQKQGLCDVCFVTHVGTSGPAPIMKVCIGAYCTNEYEYTGDCQSYCDVCEKAAKIDDDDDDDEDDDDIEKDKDYQEAKTTSLKPKTSTDASSSSSSSEEEEEEESEEAEASSSSSRSSSSEEEDDLECHETLDQQKDEPSSEDDEPKKTKRDKKHKPKDDEEGDILFHTPKAKKSKLNECDAPESRQSSPVYD